MNCENIIVALLFFMDLQRDHTCSSIVWNMTTNLAAFGQDVILTCYTFKPIQNCPVRKWTGGTDGLGLMYNGFSSNANKFEEKANFSSNQFSLIIRNFSITDINVNYTCSCGFYVCKRQLQINEQRFKYSPDEANVVITSYHGTLKIKMQMKKVYPLPICSVHVGNRVVSNTIKLIYRKSGLLYSVSFVAEYKLDDEDCNKQPIVKCELLKEQITFDGNTIYRSRCLDYTTKSSANTNVTLTERSSYKMPPSKTGFIGITFACILPVIGLVLCILRKHIKGFMGNMCKTSNNIENSDDSPKVLRNNGESTNETHSMLIEQDQTV